MWPIILLLCESKTVNTLIWSWQVNIYCVLTNQKRLETATKGNKQFLGQSWNQASIDFCTKNVFVCVFWSYFNATFIYPLCFQVILISIAMILRSTDSSNDKLSQNGMKIVAQICIFDSCVSIFDWRSEHRSMFAAYHNNRKFLFVYHFILLNIVITNRSPHSLDWLSREAENLCGFLFSSWRSPARVLFCFTLLIIAHIFAFLMFHY